MTERLRPWAVNEDAGGGVVGEETWAAKSAAADHRRSHLLEQYFFPDRNTHLNGIYEGASGQTRQYWNHAWLPGDRYLGRPVYVLTSDATFSGGEKLCYNLKTQGRAVLIGETTRGGAHPTDAVPITPSFEITVPIARSVNPVTGGNWEGTGVEPGRIWPASWTASSTTRKRSSRHGRATNRSSLCRSRSTCR